MNLKWNVNWINFSPNSLFAARVCECDGEWRTGRAETETKHATAAVRACCVSFAAFISYANLVNNNQRVLAWPTSPIHERSGAVCARGRGEQDIMQWISSSSFFRRTTAATRKVKVDCWCCAAMRALVATLSERASNWALFVLQQTTTTGWLREHVADQQRRLEEKKSFELKVQINYTSHDTVVGDRVTCEKGLKFFLWLMYFSNQSLQNLKRERDGERTEGKKQTRSWNWMHKT